MRKTKGLEPSDRISLLVQTSDSGEEMIRTFETEIKRIVGADAIDFGNASGEELQAGDNFFTVELK